MAQVFVRVVDVLGHFEVALAAAGARVVDRDARCAAARTGRSSSCGDAAERLAQAVPLAREDRPRRASARRSSCGSPSSISPCACRCARRRASPRPRHALAVCVSFCLAWWIMYMIQVPIGSTSTCAPSRSQEREHVEVAVALGGLRPELAGDLDDRLHARCGRPRPCASCSRHLAERLDVLLAEELRQRTCRRTPPCRRRGQRLEEGAHAGRRACMAAWLRKTSCRYSIACVHRPVGLARPRPRRAGSGSRRR